jgi:hypothetical protein
MKSIFTIIFLFFFSSCLIVAKSGGKQYSGDGYNLRYSLDGNFKIKFIHKFQRVTMLPDGALTGNTIDTEIIASLESTSKADENNVTCLLEKIQKISINPGGKFVEDFPKSTGNKYNLVLSSQGDVKNPGAFFSFPEPDLLFQRTAPDQFELILKSLLPQLPGKEVKKGDKWSSNYSSVRSIMNGQVELFAEINFKYTLLEESEYQGIKCLKIESYYTFESQGKGEVRNITMNLKYNGNGQETIYFSVEKGMILKKEGKLTVEGGNNEPNQTDNVEYYVELIFN